MAASGNGGDSGCPLAPARSTCGVPVWYNPIQSEDSSAQDCSSQPSASLTIRCSASFQKMSPPYSLGSYRPFTRAAAPETSKHLPSLSWSDKVATSGDSRSNAGPPRAKQLHPASAALIFDQVRVSSSLSVRRFTAPVFKLQDSKTLSPKIRRATSISKQ